ncbi:acyltransferase family protein [Microbacterium sp. P01]|uniref:acyltransferase family protein n=1 Tax=Microbacterium sp. P01 TaxID=3366261 RepID=UPI00367131E3
MVQTNRFEWVDAGRGIAISLVALFHATNWMAGTGLDLSMWVDINTVASSLRMPLFFVLSGLFAAKWLIAPWRELLRTKVLLFMWVLVIWSIIGMAVQLTGLQAAGQQVNILAGIRDVFLAPADPPFELWFIWALALFFIVAKLSRTVPVAVQLIAAGLLSAGGLTIWLTTTTGLTGSVKFYFFFIAGLYLRSIIVAFSRRSPWLLAAVFLAWAALSIALFELGFRALPGVYFLNCVVGVLAGIAISRAFSGARLFRGLGRQTLPIYLAHTPIVIAISIVFFSFPGLIDLASPFTWAVPPVVAAVAIALAVMLHRAASKTTPLSYLYQPPRVAVRALGGRP